MRQRVLQYSFFLVTAWKADVCAFSPTTGTAIVVEAQPQTPSQLAGEYVRDVQNGEVERYLDGGCEGS